MEHAATALRIEARHEFRAFNTSVSLVAADWLLARRFGRVEAFVHEFEARFSRFRVESEIGRLNAREAPVFPASPELLRLLRRCLHFSNLSGGIFNPLVLRSLEAAGYDRSFEAVAGGAPNPPATPVPPLAVLRVDEARQEIALPLPLGLDLGGIGKGYAVDLARGLLPEDANCLIDAGGDIYAAGAGPDCAGWQVDVADPLRPQRPVATVRLRDQAIATSWTTRRRWRTATGWANHLIDPRSGRSVANGLIAATVIAPRTDAADVFAKTALILGAQDGPAFLRQQGVEGLLLGEDGYRVQTPGWPGEEILEG